jgi:hypothetical protein
LTISELYEKYRVPWWIQEHMYRVASVAAVVFDGIPAPIAASLDRKAVVSAALLHDMGNIVKSNLERLAIVAPEDRPRWQEVKDDMIARYGTDDEAATLVILTEENVSAEVVRLVAGMDFLKSEAILESGDLPLMLAHYADQRAAPKGIMSMHDRLADMLGRYVEKYKDVQESVERQKHALDRMEALLFAGSSIRPEDITEESTAPVRVALASFEI